MSASFSFKHTIAAAYIRLKAVGKNKFRNEIMTTLELM